MNNKISLSKLLFAFQVLFGIFLSNNVFADGQSKTLSDLCKNSKFVGTWEVVTGEGSGTFVQIFDPQQIDWRWKADRIATDTRNTPNAIIFYFTDLSGPRNWHSRVQHFEYNLAPRGNACVLAVKPVGTIMLPGENGTIRFGNTGDQIILNNVTGYSATLKRSTVQNPDEVMGKKLVVFHTEASGAQWGIPYQYSEQRKLPQDLARNDCTITGGRLPKLSDLQRVAVNELGCRDFKRTGENSHHRNWVRPESGKDWLYMPQLFLECGKGSKFYQLLEKASPRIANRTDGRRRFSDHGGFNPFFLEESGKFIFLSGTWLSENIDSLLAIADFKTAVCIKD